MKLPRALSLRTSISLVALAAVAGCRQHAEKQAISPDDAVENSVQRSDRGWAADMQVKLSQLRLQDALRSGNEAAIDKAKEDLKMNVDGFAAPEDSEASYRKLEKEVVDRHQEAETAKKAQSRQWVIEHIAAADAALTQCKQRRVLMRNIIDGGKASLAELQIALTEWELCTRAITRWEWEIERLAGQVEP